MKIKTSEATKLQLDWGVADVMRLEPELAHHECYRYGVAVLARPSVKSVKGLKQGFSHTDPAVCMALVKEHKITLAYWNITSVWSATPDDNGWDGHGDTPEQAVARCVIAMKLGDEFECPDELGVQL